MKTAIKYKIIVTGLLKISGESRFSGVNLPKSADSALCSPELTTGREGEKRKSSVKLNDSAEQRSLNNDPGLVRNIADITINGKALGIIWKRPFRKDVASAMKPGNNQLEIKVTNLWVNRLIGGQQPDASEKFTYTTQAFYRAGSPLMEPGSIGPVNQLRIKKK